MREFFNSFPISRHKQLKLTRHAKRRVMHVDMDAFYASVEQANNPHLRGRPIVVGSRPNTRGVVLTASYEARAFGISSGMPSHKAQELCSHVIFVPPHPEQYTDVAGRLATIYRLFSPTVETYSLDEAYLDLSGCADLFDGELSLGRQMKDRIRDELKLSCSLGIAPNKTMAKMASSVYKPDGLKIIDEDNIAELLYALPVGKIPGVGPATQAVLEDMRIRTVGDLANTDLGKLRHRWGQHGEMLGRLARGADDSPVVSLDDQPREKSMGHERTFPFDTNDRQYLHATLHYLSDLVARRLRRARLMGHTVTVRLRLSDRKTFGRSETLVQPTNDALRIHHTASQIFEREFDSRQRLRLLGVSVSRLQPVSEREMQMEMFENRLSGLTARRPTGPVIDLIRNRFGERSILTGDAFVGVGLNR